MTPNEVDELNNVMFKTNWHRAFCQDGLYKIKISKLVTTTAGRQVTEQYRRKMQEHIKEHFQAMLKIAEQAGLTVRIDRQPVQPGSSQMTDVVDVRPKRGEYYEDGS